MGFFTNKLFLNILVSGLIISASSPLVHASDATAKPTLPAKEWKPFTSAEGGFSVDLPAKPDHVQQNIDVPKTDLKITYDTYLSEPNESSVFVVSVWNYPPQIDMSHPEVNLQDGFSGMLSALPGSEVLSMRMGEVQGFKALEFLVKNEDIYFQGKLILVHNTLYQVFTVYKSDSLSEESYEKFIRSFKLVNPEQRKVTPASPSTGKARGKGQVNI